MQNFQSNVAYHSVAYPTEVSFLCRCMLVLSFTCMCW